MTATLRAAVSVALLAGFYLVALGQLALAAILLLWVTAIVAGPDAVKLALPLITLGVGVAALPIGRGLARRRSRPQSIPVAPERAPDLWRVVREIAEQAGTRAPDRIRLLPDATVRITEDVRLLGLVPGTRTLYVGLPLLQILTVDRARAVLAHELGHFSRPGGVAYRGRLAVTAALPRMPINLRWYAHFYLAVDAAGTRLQEAAADRLAVTVAGPGAAIAALQDRPVLEAAWSFFFRRYVRPGWEHGYVPDDLFGGFADFVHARADELDDLRNRKPDADRWDTHAPVADRVAALGGLPSTTDDEAPVPATALLTDPAGAARALQDATVADGRRPLAWPEFIAAAGTATLRREADEVLRETGRTLGRDDVGLSEALDVAATGRFARGPVESLLLLAAVQTGAAGWRHSWSSPPRLIGRDGVVLRFGEIADLARSDRTVDEARKRLTDLGIDTGSALLAPRSGAAGAGAVAGLMNVIVNGERSDVVLLNTGLIVVPGVTRLRQRDVRPRMHAMLTSVPPEELAAAPGHRFVAYAEFADARLARRVPKTYEITLHDGAALKIRAGGDTEELGPGWSTLADATLASRT
ncbi:M48 family metallopeptidase [Catenuloplanes japonicus]|uniref:M48 family metallopeptidase n=1 Tax=Catenuloplanes japonicus TaxID=33876 RepID=UPI00068B67BD|nr:M48 family metallopeptidase [Catenuloplanes japonicus]